MKTRTPVAAFLLYTLGVVSCAIAGRLAFQYVQLANAGRLSEPRAESMVGVMLLFAVIGFAFFAFGQLAQMFAKIEAGVTYLARQKLFESDAREGGTSTAPKPRPSWKL